MITINAGTTPYRQLQANAYILRTQKHPNTDAINAQKRVSFDPVSKTFDSDGRKPLRTVHYTPDADKTNGKIRPYTRLYIELPPSRTSSDFLDVVQRKLNNRQASRTSSHMIVVTIYDYTDKHPMLTRTAQLRRVINDVLNVIPSETRFTPFRRWLA